MNENYEITKQQLYILIAASTFLACLFILLGIVIGKNYDLPRSTPSDREMAERIEVKDGEVILPDELAEIAVRRDAVSKKPHVDNEEYVFYEKMNIRNEEEETEDKDVPDDTDFSEKVERLAAEPEVVDDEPPSEPEINHELSEAFAVQVGAFTKEESARKTHDDLKSKGYYVNIFPKRFKSGNVVHQVRVGRYATQKEAETVKKKLEKEEHLSTWIVKTVFE